MLLGGSFSRREMVGFRNRSPFPILKPFWESEISLLPFWASDDAPFLLLQIPVLLLTGMMNCASRSLWPLVCRASTRIMTAEKYVWILLLKAQVDIPPHTVVVWFLPFSSVISCVDKDKD